MGKTVLVSTHLLAAIESLCDTYIFLDNGRLIGQGSLEELSQGDAAASLEDIYMILENNTEEEESTEQTGV